MALSLTLPALSLTFHAVSAAFHVLSATSEPQWIRQVQLIACDEYLIRALAVNLDDCLS